LAFDVPLHSSLLPDRGSLRCTSFCSLPRFTDVPAPTRPSPQVSHSMLRRFSSAAELLLAPLLAPPTARVLSGGRLSTSLAAMRAHKSQWVW